MCGRFSLFLPADEIEARFGAAFRESFRPRYNAAPGQDLYVVRDDDREHVRTARWGLVPSWSDDDSSGIINARSETVAEKPAFRAAYRSRRCLVPADGFYEWRAAETGKQPYRFTVGDGGGFAMAGLWETWTPETTQTGLSDFGAGSGTDDGTGGDGTGGDGTDGDDTDGGTDDGTPSSEPESLVTFTILTREPNAFMQAYHDRQPVVLGEDEEDDWLAGAGIETFDGPGPDAFDAYRVSTAVNSPANDSAAVVEPVD